MAVQRQEHAADGRRLDTVPHEWWAVQVWAGREQRCAQHLRARGYEIFLPSYREQRRWSDRRKTLKRALFAGYVFCRIVPMVTAKIVTTPGVLRIVGDSSGPLAVRADEIEAIHRIVETQQTAEPWPFLHVGQRVRIEAGPLLGTEGVLVRVKNHYRLVVCITLLQRSVAVELDAHCVGLARPIHECITRAQPG